jgi:hypothetical protein
MMLYYAAVHEKLIFNHLIGKGFSVDAMVPIYHFVITMKSTPVRSVEAMKLNDLI